MHRHVSTIHPVVLAVLLCACGQEVPLGPMPDAGDAPSSSPTQSDAAATASDVCADVRVESRRVTPNVILVVDQSGSMDRELGVSDRWNVLRDALLDDPGGLVSELRSQVRFGLALFTGEAGECPVLTTVPPALDNYEAISSVYRAAEPLGDTPTGDALRAIVAEMTGRPDPSSDPTIFVLATDGNPDTCATPDGQGDDQSVAAAAEAFRQGIRTYVIGVGRGSVSAVHLQDMANAGVGAPAAAAPAPYWEAGDDAGLREALRSIVGGAMSCLVEIDGTIAPGQACSGTVLLDGEPIACDDPNGWRRVDDSHIELLGEACERASTSEGVTLEASWPCEAILI